MSFVFVDKERFDLSFALISKLCCWDPFPVKIKFAFGGESDDIILLKVIRFQEHLVVIVSSVHDESSFPNRAAPRFMAEKVMSLMDVKSFALEEWICDKILTGSS